MARRNKGRFVKKEETPTEMHSEESKDESRKSEEKMEKHAEKSRGSFDTIALFAVGLIVGLALGGLIFYSMNTGASKTATIDQSQMDAAGQKAIDFIVNNSLISPGQEISVVNVTEVGNTGLLKMTLNISSNGQSQVFESYSTRNLEVLCPTGIDTVEFSKQIKNTTDTPDTTEPETDPAAACEATAKADKPILEAYVVSGCPFGLQMQRIMAEIISKAPDAASNMKARYIGSVENGKITSMHGDAEAQENLKQICIREEQPTKYWAYVGCYMKAGDSAGCLKTAGIDATQLNACINDSKRGLAYAQKDFDLANQNSVSGSPTVFMNGKKASEFDFQTTDINGRSAEAVKQLLCCGFNTKPAFCSINMNGGRASTGLAAEYGGTATGSSGSC